MSLHTMELTTNEETGKHGWRVVVKGQGGVPDAIIANDAHQGFNNKEDALSSLMGMFFGEWDESFLELYQQWEQYAGQDGSLPYEIKDGEESGPPVRIVTGEPVMDAQVVDADAPNYEAGGETSEG